MKMHKSFTIVYLLIIFVSAMSASNLTPWLLESDHLPREHSKVSVKDSRNGSFMASVANGFVGTVLYSDTIHVAGVYNGPAFVKKGHGWPVYYPQHTHRARVPSTCAINFTISNSSGGEVPNQHRNYILDILDGTFYQRLLADQIHVEQRIYAHRAYRNLLVVQISATNTGTGDFIINLEDNRGKDSVDINFAKVNFSSGSDSPGEYETLYGKVNITEIPGGKHASVAVVSSLIPSSVQITSKTTKTWYFVTSISTSLEDKEPIEFAYQQWLKAVQFPEDLFDKHAARWREIWDEGRIDVEGNINLAQSIYASYYYIISSTREDWPHGLSPGGLPGGEEYLGHTFWDQDIWMYPPLLMLHPGLARASLQYRHDRLEAANEIAQKFQYKGAMFPWESALTGYEVCPGEVYGEKQNHITGDIAFASKQYWMVTKDKTWLANVGYDLVTETAKFWASRVSQDPDTMKYFINDVMPPDEYHYPVNNSVYTNVVAKLNLEFAVEVSMILGKDYPPEWKNIAENLLIPYDKENDYHPEYDGFTLNDTAKQADAILTGFPLMYEMERSTRYNDIDIYESRTDPNGPAMTHAMFAIGWLELGESDRALVPFQKNYENIRGPFKVWSEISGGKGAANFITGAGGFLQAVIFGYCGIRLGINEIKFNPTLPPNSTAFTVNGIHYLGNSLKFEMTHGKTDVTLTKKSAGAVDLEIISGSVKRPLSVGKSITVKGGAGEIKPHVVKSSASSLHAKFLSSLSSVFAALKVLA